LNLLKKLQLNKSKTSYIISGEYFNQIRNNKKMRYKIKYSDSKESSFLSSELNNKIIFNDKSFYLISYPNYSKSYYEIFNKFQKEKGNGKFSDKIAPINFYNKYRLLNYPYINKDDIDKIKKKITKFYGSINCKYICYNRKIGLSVFLEEELIQEKKYFYFNVDYLINENSNSNLLNYMFFYLSGIFSDNKEEYNEYKKLNKEQIVPLVCEYKNKKLITNLINLLKNFNDIKIYFDNVKTKVQLELISHLTETDFENVKIFIQINKDTFEAIQNINYKLVNFTSNYSILDDLDFYLPYILGKCNEAQKKKEYSEKLKPFFDDYDIYNFFSILRLKYLLSEKNFYLNQLTQCIQFLEFLYIEVIRNKVEYICFRNDAIKEIFNNYYISYILKIKNINNNDIFLKFSKIEEGINLERQIIYDIIINEININKIKVDQIFSINKFPDNEFKKYQEYIFIQEKTNAPYYDFAYIYYSKDNTILKCCQIGINKSKKDLQNLNKLFILFDLYFFCQKLYYEKQIKIDKIEFCIITTYNGFKEYKDLNNNKSKNERKYKNFEIMKKYCEENKFIFLIFNPKNSEYLTYNDKNELVGTNLKFDNFQNDVKKIFIKDKYINKVKKLNYFFNLNNPNIIAEIKLIESIDEKQNIINNEFYFEIKNQNLIFKKKDNQFDIVEEKEKKMSDEDGTEDDIIKINEIYNSQEENNEKFLNKIEEDLMEEEEVEEKNNSGEIKHKKSFKYEQFEENNEKNYHKKRKRPTSEHKNDEKIITKKERDLQMNIKTKKKIIIKRIKRPTSEHKNDEKNYHKKKKETYK